MKIFIDGFGVAAHAITRKLIENHNFFDKFLAGKIKKVAMPNGGSYFPRSLPYDGYIDERWDDKTIEAFIRAMYFPPFKRTLLKKGNLTFEIESIKQFKQVFRI